VETEKPAPHQWQPEHLRLAVTAAGVALWAWNVDSDQFTMDERGGPPVKEPKDLAGYGSKLVERSVSGQLGGAIDYEWSEGGLIVTLRVNRERLAA